MLAVLVFIVAFGVGKWTQSVSSSSCAFEPSMYPLQDRSFAVAVFGRNNGAYLEKVIDSIFSQRYPNFRVIYVDDASDDGSFELAKMLLQGRGTVLRSDAPLGREIAFAKIRSECKENEILVFLEGEEWFAHEWVLARLNQYYAHPDLKIASGSGRVFPTFAKPFERGLLTCYASMLEQGSIEDLLENQEVKHIAEIPETLVIRRGAE